MERGQRSPYPIKNRSLPLVYLSVIGVFSGQQLLAPVLPPLARELGLTEFQLGLVLTISSLAIVVASPIWGRRIAAWGHKPMILVSLAGVAVAQLGFAVISHLGLDGSLAPIVTFSLMIVCRSILFGSSAAAIPVVAQSYVVDVTTGGKERVRGLAMIGASFGLAGVVGPALGALLAWRGLLLPLYVPPVLILVVAGLVYVRLEPLPRPAEHRTPPRVTPFDPRLWPFLAIGCGLFASLTALMVTLGFLLQDRLGLTAAQTARQTGLALLVFGLASLLTQAVLVRQLGWPPLRMLRCGLPMSLAAFGLLALAPNLAVIVGATALLGIGHGLAIPGYSAAPTLLVGHHEQSGVAGLIGATNGAGSIAGPLLATPLYGLSPALPFVANAALLAGALLFALLHPGVRRLALPQSSSPTHADAAPAARSEPSA